MQFTLPTSKLYNIRRSRIFEATNISRSEISQLIFVFSYVEQIIAVLPFVCLLQKFIWPRPICNINNN